MFRHILKRPVIISLYATTFKHVKITVSLTSSRSLTLFCALQSTKTSMYMVKPFTGNWLEIRFFLFSDTLPKNAYNGGYWALQRNFWFLVLPVQTSSIRRVLRLHLRSAMTSSNSVMFAPQPTLVRKTRLPHNNNISLIAFTTPCRAYACFAPESPACLLRITALILL